MTEVEASNINFVIGGSYDHLKFFFLEKKVGSDTDFENTDNDATNSLAYGMLCKACLESERDRKFILDAEKMFRSFKFITKIGDHVLLPKMSSYQRLLVHKLADLYYVCHATDSHNQCVVLKIVQQAKTIKTSSFQEYVAGMEEKDPPFTAVTNSPKMILKRSSHQKIEGPDVSRTLQCILPPKAKTLEEREKEYMEAREKIFGNKYDQDSIEELDQLRNDLDKALDLNDEPAANLIETTDQMVSNSVQLVPNINPAFKYSHPGCSLSSFYNGYIPYHSSVASPPTIYQLGDGNFYYYYTPPPSLHVPGFCPSSFASASTSSASFWNPSAPVVANSSVEDPSFKTANSSNTTFRSGNFGSKSDNSGSTFSTSSQKSRSQKSRHV